MFAADTRCYRNMCTILLGCRFAATIAGQHCNKNSNANMVSIDMGMVPMVSLLLLVLHRCHCAWLFAREVGFWNQCASHFKCPKQCQ